MFNLNCTLTTMLSEMIFVVFNFQKYFKFSYTMIECYTLHKIENHTRYKTNEGK